MTLRLGTHVFTPGARTLVMGIVNNTPDSFYDGGRHFGVDAAAAHGRTLLVEGADVLDVGGQTGQIGAEIAVADEIERVVPVIERLRRCVRLGRHLPRTRRRGCARRRRLVRERLHRRLRPGPGRRSSPAPGRAW